MAALGLAVTVLAMVSVPAAVWADWRAERAHQAYMNSPDRPWHPPYDTPTETEEA